MINLINRIQLYTCWALALKLVSLMDSFLQMFLISILLPKIDFVSTQAKVFLFYLFIMNNFTVKLQLLKQVVIILLTNLKETKSKEIFPFLQNIQFHLIFFSFQ